MTMASSSSSSPEIQGVEVQDRFSYKLATHDEVLDDLSSRFILNLPDDELSSLERICFQVEQAHWFYEDFIREENPKLPSLPLKRFSEMLFQACPLLQQWSHDHELAYTNFMQYKTRVPVCGAIMLNDTWEKVIQCVLVKGWKASSGWGFPKGKINQVEPPASCAIREVLEETGYNLAGQLNPNHVIEMSIREQKISLFIVPGVPENYPFKTKTRKEISKIEWFRLADLPTWKRNKTPAGRFYLISPFIGPLKAFINVNKPRSPRQISKSKKAQPSGSRDVPDSAAEDVVRESSSHSLYAENGEIQTPSLQCSQTSKALPSQSLDQETMDPHFAGLLSALADSASKKGTRPLHVVSTSNTHSIVNLKDMDPTMSSPATLPQETHSAATFKVSSTKPLTSGQSLSPVPHFSISVPVDSSSAATAADSAQSTVPLQLSRASVKYSQTPSRMSSTSDSHLLKQHIALLDAVSKESARMQEAYKTAVVNGVSINDNFLNPIIATTARPSSPQSHVDALKYPESIRPVPPSFITSHNMDSSISAELPCVSRLNTSPDNDFQGRSRTSLAYCNDQTNLNVTSSVSVNQTHLLALMNGAPANPTMLHTDYTFPSPSPTSLLTPYRTMVLEPQPSPFATQLHSTLSAHPVSSAPMMPLHAPTQALPTTSNALLSILNSGRRMSRFSDLPSYSPDKMRE